MTTIIITNQIPSGSAFGTTESGEGVFIPAHLMSLYGLHVGQRYQAVLTENVPELQHKTRWRLALIEADPNVSTMAPVLITPSVQPEPEPLSSKDLFKRKVLDVLNDGYVYSFRDLADLILDPGYTSQTKSYVDLTNAVQGLYVDGVIAGAAVRPMYGQPRPSFMLYADSIDGFRNIYRGGRG